VAQRQLDRRRHAQRARDVAGHLAMDLRQRTDGAREVGRGAAEPVESMVRRPPTSSPIRSENSGALAVQPDQRKQRRAGRMALHRGLVAADGGGELRGEPRGARRMVDGLAHAEVADECKGRMASKTWMGEAGCTGKTKRVKKGGVPAAAAGTPGTLLGLAHSVQNHLRHLGRLRLLRHVAAVHAW
jgi:hypothetical protein